MITLTRTSGKTTETFAQWQEKHAKGSAYFGEKVAAVQASTAAEPATTPVVAVEATTTPAPQANSVDPFVTKVRNGMLADYPKEDRVRSVDLEILGSTPLKSTTRTPFAVSPDVHFGSVNVPSKALPIVVVAMKRYMECKGDGKGEDASIRGYSCGNEPPKPELLLAHIQFSFAADGESFTVSYIDTAPWLTAGVCTVRNAVGMVRRSPQGCGANGCWTDPGAHDANVAGEQANREVAQGECPKIALDAIYH